MPPPESPLDKPSSSSHSKGPGGLRRSSSKKSVTSSSNHAMKPGSSTHGKTKPSMPASPSSSAYGPPEPEREKREARYASSAETEERRGGGRGSAATSASSGGTGDGQSETRSGEKVSPKAGSKEELERLRKAMNAQLQLTQQREKLSRSSNIREEQSTTSVKASGKSRVSPIHEEVVSPSLEEAFGSPLPIGQETTSTESVATVRGGMTPDLSHVRTPSYPFPPMRTPRSLSYNSHRPFTALSPTVNPTNFSGGNFDSQAYDKVQSGSVTPASTPNFLPRGTSPHTEDPNSETPNLYTLSLMLMSEPGLDSWWTTVAKIMKDLYKADRVTLTIPADPTDVENVPWAQKATFNTVVEDELSLTYLPRGSSFIASSNATNEADRNNDDENDLPGESPLSPWQSLRPARPGLDSRHSFTAYENVKRETPLPPDPPRNNPSRPSLMSRAKSYVGTRSNMPQSLPPRGTTLQAAGLSLQSLQRHMEYEEAKSPVSWEDRGITDRETHGRVFPVLQALEYEADPLIDNMGVMRVLEREKLVVLTRDYPYNGKSEPDERSSGSGSKTSQRSSKSRESLTDKSKKGKAPDLSSRIQSFLGSKSKHTRHSSRDPPSLQTRYEEYEQGPPSPWAQSPAPSPAVRAETDENPFFANSTINESFDPIKTPKDYTQSSQLEAIGVDRSWTVLHVPLMHPLLSKAVHEFRLDTAALQSKSACHGKSREKKGKPKESEPMSEKRTPVAILSVLSPVIPYPSSLRHSLEFLAPHLASSYSMCRHHTNLQTEIAGLSRRGPRQAGFGAVVSGNRPLDDRINTDNSAASLETGGRQSTGGSITSPSDYSGVSRSTAGSPAVTPVWEASNSVGFVRDKRLSGGSPSNTCGESYFAPRVRPSVVRVDTGSAFAVSGTRRSSKEASPTESRSYWPARTPEERRGAAEENEPSIEGGSGKSENEGSRSSSQKTKQDLRPRRDRSSREFSTDAPTEAREASPDRQHHENPPSPRRQVMRTASHQAVPRERSHTQLHSYGADFSATFQSLPTTTGTTTKPLPGASPPSRAGSISLPTEMPPPSDRVKGLMLDSLPAHVFVAMPPSGEIVWVNNRYLTYRGQTVQDLYQDPWVSLHPDERDEYLKAWSHAIRSGEQFSKQVRIKRFDGSYRWFYTRAVGHRDHRGVIVQWYGTHMDIHDQHLAEVKAARQEEIEASEAKHRQLANLIPQITFAATEDDGITFANEQWLSYTGQSFNDALGLGFMDYIHAEDLAKCHIPQQPPTPTPFTARPKKPKEPSRLPSQSSSGGHSSTKSSKSSSKSSTISETPTETTVKGIYQSLSRNNSSGSESVYEFPIADLSELAKTGVIKIATDSDGRQSYETEVRLRSKSGNYRWHLVRCVEVENIALGSGDGSWFGACTDIHDHKLLEKTLKDTMDVKARFLSNMSHEIRTPLIGISGMVNFLQDTPLTDEQADYSNTIKSSADSLLNIINDILDLSKVDAGMMKLSHQWFHTRSLVEEVNEILCSLAITKRIELNYVVDSDVPDMVKGDKFRIRQVLLNIVGNAIKFTTIGEVFSRCRVVKDATLADNEIMLEHSIIDTGSGFTQEEAEMIFKPFSQIDGSSTRTHGGTGLGLVISRQLVELHGGKMEGSSIPGKGSTFRFTAKFALPTEDDHPNAPLPTPGASKDISGISSGGSSVSGEASSIGTSAQAVRLPSPASQILSSPPVGSPRTESSIGSPSMLSSGSSDPSIRSARSHGTQRSSTSSITQNLLNFGQAARAGISDLGGMKLALPERQIEEAGSLTGSQTPVGSTSSRDEGSQLGGVSTTELKHFRPPMYSILIICPQTHSREATTQHIEMTLPKDTPHQITALASVEEAQEMINGDDPVIFTHIVLNLGSKEAVVELIDQIIGSISLPNTSIVVLSDPVQRQEIIKMATVYDYDQLAKDKRVTFVFKPVKPSRFAVIFDPEKERALSTDRNRSTAAQQVADQKQSYLDVTKRLGNRGLKVLLVEDNLVNQKVLLKFLSKVGIAVELALDGVECTKKVFSQGHFFYSLILCDLHMPNKDGYETCREIRQWEKRESLSRMPIIALSANVMADVMDKCIEAGFNDYVTKPVDFKALSQTMGDLLDPEGAEPAIS
ncbi:hypothetical protein BJ875DRAFT_11666 [Amylocarpus encephaloides]|uniref:Uncharacterized protein n=1 Tax=Amylocarpus encephaloides TaxID=45428 RepID=A0A9P8C5R5_9HELO|nr:hypothetical protein BJ875DRAFT_11666 [Amylocarpus encephaloides]